MTKQYFDEQFKNLNEQLKNLSLDKLQFQNFKDIEHKINKASIKTKGI